jgi:regulator of protease activity HflC (stomatin/prohibitin superfamily)
MIRAFGRTIPSGIASARLLRQSPSSLLTRGLSSFLDFDEDLDRWPRTRANTGLNVCPQGTKMVVERLGKFYKVYEGGMFIAIPVVDNIRFVVDMREKAMKIVPQSAITKDNVHVHVSGNLYCQFVDAEKAAYGSNNPLYAVKQHAQSAMRAAIGELELDEILHARAQLNEMIKKAVSESAIAWGLDIKRYEITEITPDKFITEAMDKQAAAERERRKKVLDAEGDKRSAELESEGLKIKLKNESEGTLIKITNEAEARKIQLLLEVSILLEFFSFFKYFIVISIRRRVKPQLSLQKPPLKLQQFEPLRPL